MEAGRGIIGGRSLLRRIVHSKMSAPAVQADLCAPSAGLGCKHTLESGGVASARVARIFRPGALPQARDAIVGGNCVVAIASESRPLAAIELAEALATSDLPGGVVNILTGHKGELAPWLAGHMDVNALDLAGADGEAPELERLAAENVKRVVRSRPDGQSPWEIAAFLEMKTVWHPIGR